MTIANLPPPEFLAMMVRFEAGPEGNYDGPTADHLKAAHDRFLERLDRAPARVRSVGLGQRVPWLYLLDFDVRGLGRTAGGRGLIDQFKLRVPLFGDLIRKTSISRFSRTLGTLVTSGVPIRWLTCVFR